MRMANRQDNRNDLKRLTREEILELLIESEKKNAEYVQALEEEKNRNAELTGKLNQRLLDIDEAGSIAEASLKVSGIFENAQKAAEEYLFNIKELSGRQEAICREMEEKSKKQAEELKKKTVRECEELRKQTEEECWKLENETCEACEKAREAAKTEAENYWSALSERLEEFYKAHEGMKELLSFYNMKIPEIKKSV